ncbi:GhoT/OrtT family toxin [Shigella flexneri]
MRSKRLSGGGTWPMGFPVVLSFSLF